MGKNKSQFLTQKLSDYGKLLNLSEPQCSYNNMGIAKSTSNLW